MIVSRWLRLFTWGAALLSGTASAVGLGEINLHSRIGEPIRAELPISGNGDQLDVACFSLASVPGADLPVVTGARLRLVRIGPDYRLIIAGGKAIDEPVFMISVRAHCGIDLQREYVLLPGPPIAPSHADYGEEPAPAPVAPAPRKRRPPPENVAPDAAGDAAPNPPPKPRPPRGEGAASGKPKAPLPPSTLASLNTGQDRVILGAAPETPLAPGASDPLASTNVLDERLLKMETTLHLLNEEVDKLNSALALNAESRAMRQKLQDLQASQGMPAVQSPLPPAAPPTVAGTGNSADGWIELVLGVLLGGSVSATVAHLVSRRQENGQPFVPRAPHIAKPKPAKASRT